VLGSFLTLAARGKRKPVFVVATANDIAALPPELLRKGRFDEILLIDLPDVHERESIFAIHFRSACADPRRFGRESRSAPRGPSTSRAPEIEQVVVAASTAPSPSGASSRRATSASRSKDGAALLPYEER